MQEKKRQDIKIKLKKKKKLSHLLQDCIKKKCWEKVCKYASMKVQKKIEICQSKKNQKIKNSKIQLQKKVTQIYKTK